MLLLMLMSLLVVIAMFIAYGLVYAAFVILPIILVSKQNLSKITKYSLSIVIFLIVTALFWGKDISSYATYQYQCVSKEKLNIYKTLKQWKQENPNVWETLKEERFYRYRDPNIYPNLALEKQFNGKNYKISTGGNQRILVYSRAEYSFKPLILEENYIVFDNKTQQILADYTKFGWKSTWYNLLSDAGITNGRFVCSSQISDYWNYRNSFSNPELKFKWKQ